MWNPVQTRGAKSFAQKQPARRRSVAELLAPLGDLVERSPDFVPQQSGRCPAGSDGQYESPRYRFSGPRGGDAPIRIGISAGLHGEEPERARAAVRFFQLLEVGPEMAQRKEVALVAALQEISTEFRKFIAYAPNV